MLAGRVSAPCCASRRSGRTSTRRACLSPGSATSFKHHRRADLCDLPRAAAGDPRQYQVRPRVVPLSDRRTGSPARCQLRRCRPDRRSALSARRVRARAPSPSWCSACTCRKAPGFGRRHGSRDGRPGLAAPPDRRRFTGEHAVQPVGCARYIAPPTRDADGARDRGGAACGARTTSFLELTEGYDTMWASAARAFGRPAPTHRDRTSVGDGPADSDLRRGDQRARL